MANSLLRWTARSSGGFLWLACAGASLAIAAPYPPFQAAFQAAAPDGSVVEGKVLDNLSHQPVVRADVTLAPLGQGTGARMKTDAAGAFHFDGVAPGRYTLTAEARGYLKAYFGTTRPNALGATPVAVPLPTGAPAITLSMTPMGIVTGQVQDDFGDPVRGVVVEVLVERLLLGKPQLLPAFPGAPRIQTDDRGEFRVPDLRPGPYFVVATPQRTGASESPVIGTASGEPREALVQTYYPGTDDPAAAARLDVRPGVETRTLIRLQKTRVFRVEGTVLRGDSGTAVTDGTLIVFSRGSHASHQPVSTYGIRDDEGRFLLTDLHPGTYRVAVVPKGSADRLEGTLTVGQADLTGLALRVDPGPRIPVRVQVEGDTSVAGATVYVASQEDALSAADTEQITGANPNPTLKNLPPGRYWLAVSKLPDGFYLKEARFGQQDVLESGLDLQPGDASSLDLVIGPGAAELVVTARAEGASAAARAIVTLVPKDPKGRTGLYRVVLADDKGTVRLRNVVPGEYLVFAWEDVDMDAPQTAEYQRRFERYGATVQVAEGGAQSVAVTAVPRESVQ